MTGLVEQELLQHYMLSIKIGLDGVLAGGAIVLLITDGLERDFSEDLEAEAARLHRSLPLLNLVKSPITF